jgi:DNA replication factor GINS
MVGMSEDTITFDLIRRIQREEQKSPKLSKIPDNFYQSVMSYLSQKRQMSREDRKNILEIKSIERLVEDVFDRRERKIVTAAVNAARANMQPDGMTQEERDFFELIKTSIKQRRDIRLKAILSTDKKEEENLVIFKEEVPEFIGSDMRQYGPFKKGDLARLPDENTRLLVEQGLAEKFKVIK